MPAGGTCRFCGAELEAGCLMGKDSLLGFQWYRGEPTFWKNAFPHGESMGGFELRGGTYLKGVKCERCRKLILDY